MNDDNKDGKKNGDDNDYSSNTQITTAKNLKRNDGNGNSVDADCELLRRWKARCTRNCRIEQLRLANSKRKDKPIVLKQKARTPAYDGPVPLARFSHHLVSSKLKSNPSALGTLKPPRRKSLNKSVSVWTSSITKSSPE